MYRQFYLFLYYNDEKYELDYAYYDILDEYIVKYGVLADNVHGAWLKTTSLPNITNSEEHDIGIVYADVNSGLYEYGLCSVNINDLNVSCSFSIIDKNISVPPSDKECNEYNLCVYPDIKYYQTFNKYIITSYFDKNSVKFAQCNNWQCNDKPYIQTLSNGSFGYGRDTSIAWFDKYKLLYISFLDYRGDGTDKKTRLLICD